MAKTIQKITLSTSRDIPFNKLVLSQSNVRHVTAGLSIEELAEEEDEHPWDSYHANAIAKRKERELFAKADATAKYGLASLPRI